MGVYEVGLDGWWRDGPVSGGEGEGGDRAGVARPGPTRYHPAAVKPDSRYRELPKPFWALVKLVSEGLGYSKKGSLKRYSTEQVADLLVRRELDPARLAVPEWLALVADYSEYRATVLETIVRPALMTKEQARAHFDTIFQTREGWTCSLPKNKLRGNQAHPNYLGAIVNMIAEQQLGPGMFDSNPLGLATITRGGVPLRTLSRRMDGAFPRISNPTALWEVKEYYGTTTFGSRVADGVYETMLDGTELLELREMEGITINHYLMVDDLFTWWSCGKSYLCRIVDMLHGDLVDEVFFGRQVIEDWPAVVGALMSPPDLPA